MDQSSIDKLEQAMNKARQDIKHEEYVMYLLQRICIFGNTKDAHYFDMEAEETDQEKHIWEEAVWNMVLKLKPDHEVTKNAIRALYELTIPRHTGGGSGCRLRLFHAVVLYVILNAPRTVIDHY